MRSLLLFFLFRLGFLWNMIYQLNVYRLWTHGLIKCSYDITTHHAKVVEASSSINLGKLVNQWDIQELCKTFTTNQASH